MKKITLIFALFIATSNLYCPPERTEKGRFLQQAAFERLNTALQTGNSNNVKAVIANKIDKNSFVWPIVNYALATGNIAILQSLKGFHLNFDQVNKEGKTPLLEAIQQKKPFVAQALLLLGANPNTANEQGITPLMLAVVKWDEQSARQLLHFRADPFLKSSEDKTAFEYAKQTEEGTAFENPVGTLLRDLDYGLGEFDRKENLYEQIFSAIAKGDTKTLNTIIDNNKDFFIGQNFNPKITNGGQTPLSIAITTPGISKEKRTDFVEILLTRTAFDINTRNNDGTTALHQAIVLDDDDIIAQFIDNDDVQEIDINPQDNEGKTPLHKAVEMNNFDAIERLLELGADTTIEDYTGKKPSYYATTETALKLVNGEPVNEEQKKEDEAKVKEEKQKKKATEILLTRPEREILGWKKTE